MAKRSRICIVQPVMKGYRLPFFNGLNEHLKQINVDLEVVYGTPWQEEAKRGDDTDLPAPLGRRVESRLIGGKLLWIPVLQPLLQADRIIVEHANKNALNYPLALAQVLGMKRVGYWGHGRDRQVKSDTPGEIFKRRSLHWADWWFAYTEGAAEYVRNQGFDRNRITTVGNAVDTRELATQVASVTSHERGEYLAKLALDANGTRLIYCGSLYANKRLDLMFGAADALQSRMPSTQLIIVGGGPLTEDAKEFAESRPWVRYVGPQFGRQKAIYLSLADVWLNPGLVGLGILDAFSAGLPLVTTDLPLHSPEIEYLEHGFNGLMVAPDTEALTNALFDLLSSETRLQHFRQGALASALKYSIDTMIENYAQGVIQWLKS